MAAFLLTAAVAPGEPERLPATDAGAVGDDHTINTPQLQSAIDRLAAGGGGTLVIPRGVFVSGALFLKPGVDLHLDEGAVLKCTTDMAHFPPRRTRIEGHFEESFTPALINADGCDGLRISGPGTLDGAGRPVWDLFWERRRAAPDPQNFPNLSIPRARLCLIENSRDVRVEGVTFKDSQFWNLHLYHCREVRVEGVTFRVPDDYRQAPSSDGIDVDSCQDVTITGCMFSVTDDCIALKGTKGPQALADESSPPVERVRVSDCEVRRGHALVTLGSEATIVRDVVVENCRVFTGLSVLNLKLRPDTPQRYENIHFRDLTLHAAGGALVSVRPWTQYFDVQGQPPPPSIVRDVAVSGVRGRFGSLGAIRGNPRQTEIAGITLRDVALQVAREGLGIGDGVRDVTIENVTLNGQPFTLPATAASAEPAQR